MSDKPTLKLPDGAVVKQSLSRITRTGRKLISDYLSRRAKGEVAPPPVDAGAPVGKAFRELSQQLLANPQKVLEVQKTFWKDYLALVGRTSRRVLGAEVAPVIEPGPTDRRFRDEDWARSAIFDFVKQSYLLTARSVQQTVTSADGLDPKTAERVDFYTRQFVDALAPSNLLALNPTVLKATLSSGGENLIKGFANLLEDLDAGQGDLRIRMTDLTAFEVGRDVAVTPGKVIFQNDLMELLQYAPSTEQVQQRPLLIVPPWINKFYVVDLSPKNSFVCWAVAQGLTVFVISWRNPDETMAKKAFEDYLGEGPLAALDAIERATGQREVAAVGYCLGGTLLACALAYLAGKGDQRITAATLFTTMTDFSEPGELGVFIDEDQLQGLEKQMGERGYLDGGQMAAAFSMLRSNDLIWSFVVQNYLLGRDPMPFDILYWGSDATRMPAKMHGYYLRNMYQHNLFREPDGITLLGQPLDLRKVTVPVYFLSCREDYIAPWTTTYLGTQLVAGPVRFVLSGSGHIAGVINPAGSKKYGYVTNPEVPPTAEAWLAGAEPHAGSWWGDWFAWVAATSGPAVPARQPGGGALPALADAPGSYVRVRY
jgi:polyhydroxyalkanoate synthase